MAERPNILILGAGFAGVETAKELARLLPRDEDARITLVDQNNFLLFTPMLIEVLGGQVDMMHIVAATRHLNPRIEFIQARVESVDLAAKSVSIRLGGRGYGDKPATHTLTADHIVIALGSVPNFFDIPGLRETAITMKNLCDAGSIRNRTLALLERADSEPDLAAKRSLLTFIVGGGGFSGVETAAALRDMLQNVVRFYPNVENEDILIIVIEALGRLLPELNEDLAEYARQKLEQCGVQVMLNTKIVEVGLGYVELDGNRCVYGHTLIWTGGVSPVAVVRRMGARLGRHHGIVTDSACAVPDRPGVWALGDCAEVPKPGSDKPYAPTAQNATREGKLAARNIVAAMRGRPTKEFDFEPIGEVAALGRRSGVASLRGIHLSGFVAWFLWRTIYLFKLPHLRQRIRVGIDWALDLIFGREIVELPTDCFVAGVCPGLEEIESMMQSESMSGKNEL